MPLILFILCASLWFGCDSYGALIAYEPFDYDAPQAISTRNGGIGWKTAWTGSGLVLTGGMAFPSLLTSSNSVRISGDSTKASRVIATNGFDSLLTPDGKWGRDGTELWLSFLMERQSTGSPFARGGVILADGGTDVMLIGAAYAWWGVRLPGSVVPAEHRVVVDRWTTFVVLRLKFGGPGEFDNFSFYVNPPPGTLPPAVPDLEFGSVVSIQFDRLRIGSENGAVVSTFDELRLGETYADVAPSNGRLEIMLQDSGRPLPLISTDSAVRIPFLIAGSGTDGKAPEIVLNSLSPLVAGLANLRWIPSLDRAEGALEIQAARAGTATLSVEARGQGVEPAHVDFSLDVAPAPPAGLLAYEGFDYAAGTAALSGNGGFGFKTAWSTLAAGSRTTIVSNSLPHDSLSQSGNHVECAANTDGAVISTRFLSASMGTPGTVRYLSLLARPQGRLGVGQYGGYFGVEVPGTAGSSLIIGKAGQIGTKQWTLEFSGGLYVRSSTVDLTTNQTALLVAKFEFFNGPDRVSLFVNPTPGGNEPAEPSGFAVLDIELGSPSRLTLASSGAWAVDELRLGTTWASVTVNPAVAPPLKLALPRDLYALGLSPLNYLTRLTESIAPLQPTFSLLNGPAGMTIDATTGAFNYTPTENDVAKDFAVGVRVTDNASPLRSDEASFALHIIEMDQPPVAVAAITNNQTNVIVSWPFPSTGFALESTTNLAATIWLPAAERALTNGGRWEITAPLDSLQRFFRLHMP